MGHPDCFSPERLCLPVCSARRPVRCAVLIRGAAVERGSPGRGRAVTGASAICVDKLADV